MCQMPNVLAPPSKHDPKRDPKIAVHFAIDAIALWTRVGHATAKAKREVARSEHASLRRAYDAAGMAELLRHDMAQCRNRPERCVRHAMLERDKVAPLLADELDTTSAHVVTASIYAEHGIPEDLVPADLKLTCRAFSRVARSIAARHHVSLRGFRSRNLVVAVAMCVHNALKRAQDDPSYARRVNELLQNCGLAYPTVNAFVHWVLTTIE